MAIRHRKNLTCNAADVCHRTPKARAFGDERQDPLNRVKEASIIGRRLERIISPSQTELEKRP